jgi:GNAT superfamily N-acetyltransferase
MDPRRVQIEMPGNPLSIELTISNRSLWWHIADDDDQPERWDVSADVWALDNVPDHVRHVGDIELVVADLTGEQNLLDSIEMGQWALEFIAEIVIEPSGRLHRELDQRISDGPPRMVVVRHVTVADGWRGHGLGPVLLAGALRRVSPTARLAACRVSPTDFQRAGEDRLQAEFQSVRAAAMLERIGFTRWREVHILDLRDPALIDAGIDVVQRWWPNPKEG